MTNNEPNQQPYPQNYPPYEDEINLIDYLRVLWKWKWLIMAGTLVFAVIAAVISLRMPEIYEISTVIEPAIIGVDDSGNYTYMDSKNISGKINEGAYNNSIKKLLNINFSKANPVFKADVGNFTNQIRISTKCKEKDINLGLKASKQLLALISDNGEKVVQKSKDDYARKIIAKQNNIKKFETQGELLKETLKDVKRMMGELKKEVDNIENNTVDLIKQRNLLLKESKAKAEMPLLLYSTTIQQNISYLNQINNQIYDFKEKEKEALQEIGEAERGIDTAKTEIGMLEVNKELFGNIKVIQEPEVSSAPVKSKKKQIILLSVVVGLFFMIFLAFFIEYIKNASKPSSVEKGR